MLATWWHFLSRLQCAVHQSTHVVTLLMHLRISTVPLLLLHTPSQSAYLVCMHKCYQILAWFISMHLSISTVPLLLLHNPSQNTCFMCMHNCYQVLARFISSQHSQSIHQPHSPCLRPLPPTAPLIFPHPLRLPAPPPAVPAAAPAARHAR